MSRRPLGTMKILLGIQGGQLLTGEHKPTLMPIRRLGPIVVNFYLMIITPPMMRRKGSGKEVPLPKPLLKIKVLLLAKCEAKFKH